jgi:hypothetical protein
MHDTPDASPRLWRLPPPDPSRRPRPENRFAIDYRAAARALSAPACTILDIHSHINGAHALGIFRQAADAYGVGEVFTMVGLGAAKTVREVFGSRARFIAFPNMRSGDRRHAMTEGFLEDIQGFHDDYGARLIKLWNAPRMFDFFPGDSGEDLIAFDSPWRVRHVELASSLGMGVMVHVADPDTWFATRYADATKYRMKREHYLALERMLDRFPVPWLGAHMGGYPEDLAFLDGLLTRHANLHLDTSATKWVVRELSRHPRERVVDFLTKWRGRILFGSDIVTTDEQLSPPPLSADGVRHPMADLADSPETAFDLYASRYLALRMMFETDYQGLSPIADPDLRMVDPSITDPLAAPQMRGLGLSGEMLATLYRGAAVRFLAKVGERIA